MKAQTGKPVSTYSPADLAERAIQRRAVEAVIWGMSAVNTDLMYQALVRAKGAYNQIAYWSHLPDWKNQTLTPNPDAIYFMPFFNTKDVGPMVLEIPPASDEGSITGSIRDVWQSALEDVGPAGVDKGKGGKYLVRPTSCRMLSRSNRKVPARLRYPIGIRRARRRCAMLFWFSDRRCLT